MSTGNEIVFQVTYTPAKPQNYLKGNKLKSFYDQRKFYTCNQSDDILYYASHGETKDIISYSEDKKKSYGIFGQKGMLTGIQIKSLRNTLQNTDSCVWHGFISFEEKFGIKHCNNIDSAIRFMQRNFNSRFLSKTHLNTDNVTWIAALHENTENYHIHFLFFEKEPKLLTGNGHSRYTSKGKINGWAIKNAKVEFYSYFLTKACAIQNMRDEILSEIKQKYLGFNRTNDCNDKILRQIKMLSLKLPSTGSLKYGSRNMEGLRPEIDGITNKILSRDKTLSKMYKQFNSVLLKRDIDIREFGVNTDFDTANMMIRNKIICDLYSRIGSKVIDTALYIRKTRLSPIDKNMPRFAAKSIRRNKRKSMYREYMHLLNRINDTSLDCFEEYLKNIARIEEEQIMMAKIIQREGNEV